MQIEDYRTLEAKQTTEEAFRRALRKTAHDYGFVHQYHTRFSVGSDSGFPDEVFVNDEGRCVVFECKRVGKKPTERQYAWLEVLRRVSGIEAYWVTPADWDRIHAILKPDYFEEA